MRAVYLRLGLVSTKRAPCGGNAGSTHPAWAVPAELPRRRRSAKKALFFGDGTSDDWIVTIVSLLIHRPARLHRTGGPLFSPLFSPPGRPARLTPSSGFW